MDATFAGPARQAELLRSGRLGVKELVERYLARIQRLNPAINAFRIVTADAALAAADTAQEAIDDGDNRPLLGIPFAVKDDQDLVGHTTSEGTDAVTTKATADSDIVARLKAAGAIPIGKTLAPELCIWPWTESKRWNATRNPWDPNRTSGGSSGGSASAVAAGLVSFATGSDGGGSIRIPAACCGLVGLKVQRDRISIAPRTDVWNGLSVYGVLTRTVADTALILDSITPESPISGRGDTATLRQLRIGLSYDTVVPGLKLDSNVIAGVESVAEKLTAIGHDVLRVDLDASRSAIPAYMVRFLNGCRKEAARLDNPEKLEARTKTLLRPSALVPDRLVGLAESTSARFAERLNAVFDRVDVLLTPTIPWLPVPVGHTKGWSAGRALNFAANFAAFTTPWNLTGQPAISLPAGFTPNGVPLAAQFITRPNDEAVIIELATQIETVAEWAGRRPEIEFLR